MSAATDSGNSTLPVVLAAISATAVVCVGGFLLLDSGIVGGSDKKETATTVKDNDEASEPTVTQTIVTKTQKPQTTKTTEVIVKETTVTKTAQPARRGDVDLTKLARVRTSRSLPPARGRTGKRYYYSGAMAVDRVTYTGWGMKGDATGERITFAWDRPVTISDIGLINGYKKVDNDNGEDRYWQNRRVTSVRWSFSDGTSRIQPLTDGVKAPQMDTLDTPVKVSSVTMEIAGTTQPGTYKHNDTVVSEIYIKGTP